MPATRTAKVDAAALDAAEQFVLLNARLLDRHRFAHQFRGGPADAVVAALRPYVNTDGGFGHALEPDLRGPGSQPEPVEVALWILHETGDGRDRDVAFADPMVRGACDYLMSITTPDGGVPFVLPSVGAAPRAPWWQTDPDPPGALVPTASLAGLLHAHGVDHPWLDGATRFCRDRIEAVGDLGPYEARAVLHFLDHVPDRGWAEAAFTRVRGAILATVTFDPDAPGHVHLPLAFAPTPEGFGRRLFDDDVIDRHLDVLVAAQSADGGWGFNWPAWADVTVAEWRGHVTVDQLKTLRAHGRWAV
jgi:hypothetical protein